MKIKHSNADTSELRRPAGPCLNSTGREYPPGLSTPVGRRPHDSKQMTNSHDLAVTVAVLLERSPEMAAQIKNFIPEARLIELLQLTREAEPVKPERGTPAVFLRTRLFSV
jgi:hypothetical protein